MSGISFVNPQGLAQPVVDLPVRAPSRLARWRSFAATHWLAGPALAFIVHFLIIQVVATAAFTHGQLTASYLTSRSRAGVGRPVDGRLGHFIQPLDRWDGIWYIRAATSGLDYRGNIQFERFGNVRDTLWPLLPWVMKAGAYLPGATPALVGYLFVNICFFVALAALYRLIAQEFDTRIARRSVWCLALLPTAFFFQTISTEAPFLCFAALAFLAARNDRWFLAGLFGLLAALTQSHGVLLILPLLVLGISEIRAGRRRWTPRLAFLLLPLIGPLIYLNAWHKAGYDWRLLLTIQEKQFALGAPPWKSIACAVNGCSYQRNINGNSYQQGITGTEWSWARQLLDHPGWNTIADQSWRHDLALSGSLDLVITAGCLLLAVAGLFWLPRWMKVYTLTLLIAVLVRTPFEHPLDGMARFSLLLFPLAIVLAKLLDERLTRTIACLVSVALLIGLTAQFANWYWVS